MFKLIKAEVLRYSIELRNYYPDQIVDIIIKYVLFYAFFRGVTLVSAPTEYFIGYMYWVFASTIISEMSISMSSEKQNGTIEHIMMMPHAIEKIIIIRTYVVFLFALIKSLILFLMVKLTLSIELVSTFTMLFVLLFSIIGFTGIGLFLSGLTLKYAKVASFDQLISYGLLLVSGVVLQLNAFPEIAQKIMNLFPYTMAIRISQESINKSINIGELLLILLLNIVFFGIGLFIFRMFLSEAKQKGIVSQY